MNAITSPEIQTLTAVQIREQFAQKREQGLRAKDAAEALNLSEGAVIAAHGGEHERTLKAVPLRTEWLAGRPQSQSRANRRDSAAPASSTGSSSASTSRSMSECGNSSPRP